MIEQISMPDILLKYFPDLTPSQHDKFRDFADLITEWNQKINVISRKDIENLYERHILHSLAIARVVNFNKGCRVMDVGTGGGFPGIPLAILFPEAEFILVDSIAKKIKVVRSVAESLELKNVKTLNERVENIDLKVDFVVARAVTETEVFWNWVNDKIRKNTSTAQENGLLYLKGLDQASNDMKEMTLKSKIYRLNEFFEEEFFESKALLRVWME